MMIIQSVIKERSFHDLLLLLFYFLLLATAIEYYRVFCLLCC